MSDIKVTSNPFAVISPENLTADQVIRLLVEVVPDFNLVGNAGHSMIMGARGTGKSMMFRSLLPDVQMLKKSVGLAQLPFLAFHIPIKNAQLHLTELVRLDGAHASSLINEHFLVLYFLVVILRALRDLPLHEDVADQPVLEEFWRCCFTDGLLACGCHDLLEFRGKTIKEMFSEMYKISLKLHSDFMRFVTCMRPDIESRDIRYDLPLLSYQMFLLPFLSGLKTLPGFPNGEVYLLIDDADNLSRMQTKVLNTWLSSRTAFQVGLKVSTQLGRYKTFHNVNDIFVEAPHDYQEINITERYSRDFRKYYKRIAEIVEKRLKDVGIEKTAEAYFPQYEDQEVAIRKEIESIKQKKSCDDRQCRDNDAPRYARANYIRSLGIAKNARYSYRYAGFEQLVWLSSGVVRYFLDAAATMYDYNNNEAATPFDPSSSIPYQVQDAVVRSRADDRMYLHFAKLSVNGGDDQSAELVRKLQNLVSAIGEAFHNKLVSRASARRFSSIALTKQPTEEVRAVLDFGVENGYLHPSTIGNKTGTKKIQLYSLNKSLFPHFGLDPIGDYGNMTVTNEALQEAFTSGKALRGAENEDGVQQLDLFE